MPKFDSVNMQNAFINEFQQLTNTLSVLLYPGCWNIFYILKNGLSKCGTGKNNWVNIFPYNLSLTFNDSFLAVSTLNIGA